MLRAKRLNPQLVYASLARTVYANACDFVLFIGTAIIRTNSDVELIKVDILKRIISAT